VETTPSYRVEMISQRYANTAVELAVLAVFRELVSPANSLLPADLQGIRRKKRREGSFQCKETRCFKGILTIIPYA
jgi:hypothetical protein